MSTVFMQELLVETNSEYEKILKARLKELQSNIYLLEAKVRNVEVGERHQYVRGLDVLHSDKREITKRLADLEKAIDNNWNDVKVTTDGIRGGRGPWMVQGILKYK